MKANGIINHDTDNFYNKKTVLIDGEEYFIANDSIPESLGTGVFDYEPSEAFALYLPEETLEKN